MLNIQGVLGVCPVGGKIRFLRASVGATHAFSSVQTESPFAHF